MFLYSFLHQFLNATGQKIATIAITSIAMLQDIQIGENTHHQDQVITSHNFEYDEHDGQNYIKSHTFAFHIFSFLKINSESLQVLQNILWKSDFKKCRLW